MKRYLVILAMAVAGALILSILNAAASAGEKMRTAQAVRLSQ